MSSDAAPAVREVEAPAAEGGVVIPFPRRQVFVWMAAAAGVLMAVTLWSVSRLGDRPVSSVAMSAPTAEAPAPLTIPPVPPPAAVERGVARQEQDKRKPDSRSDALAIRQPAEFAAAEEKQAVEQYGSSDSGASLGDILGAALKKGE